MPDRSSASLTIGDLLRRATDYLKEKGIESPRLTAEVLLAHLLKVDRVTLYLHFEKPLTPTEISGYRSLIRRRLAREPLQYIVGMQEFWSLEFEVGPGVLVPRPETELLVEEGMELVKAGRAPSLPPLRVLDMGTGSGALAISMAKEFPEARIWATDISLEALHVARGNARTHQVIERVTFLPGDLWEALAPYPDLSFDLILSNPPYVSSEEYEDLPPEVRDFEPRVALDGGEGGMSSLTRIIAGAPDRMREGAWLLLEMAPAQTEVALEQIRQSGQFVEAERVRDYSRRYRVVKARKKD